MPTLKLRNFVARTPLLRKGGVHVKSKSGQRAQVKKAVKQEMRDWKNGKSSHGYF